MDNCITKQPRKASVATRTHLLWGKHCARCERKTNLIAHHIVALADGGEDDVSNSICLCELCHAEWHYLEHFTIIDFYDWLCNVPALHIVAIACVARDIAHNESPSAEDQVLNTLRNATRLSNYIGII